MQFCFVARNKKEAGQRYIRPNFPTERTPRESNSGGVKKSHVVFSRTVIFSKFVNPMIVPKVKLKLY